MKKFAFVILALATMAACQKAEELVNVEPEVTPPAGAYTLTVKASKTVDSKALSLDGSALNAHWEDGETVAVYQEGNYLGQLEATADGTDATKATLSGTLIVTGVTQGAELMLLFPRADWDYTGQDGTIATIGSTYDYASATVTVASVDDVNNTITTTDGADFVNQQSVYRFGFKVSGEPLSVNGFSVGSANNALVRSRSWEGSDWTENCGTIEVNTSGAQAVSYVSLRNTLVGTPTQEQIADKSTIDTYYFYVIGSDNALYTGQKKIPAQVMDVQGKFISAQNISVTKPDLSKSGTATVVW